MRFALCLCILTFALPCSTYFNPIYEGYLYSKGGTYLQMHKDGSINGSFDIDNPSLFWQIHSVSKKIITLFNTTVRRYICLSKKAQVLTVRDQQELMQRPRGWKKISRKYTCIYIIHQLDGYWLFRAFWKSSKKRRSQYIALSSSGKLEFANVKKYRTNFIFIPQKILETKDLDDYDV